GEEHDLAVLAERVRAEARATRASGAPGRGTRKALLKLIARRRRSDRSVDAEDRQLARALGQRDRRLVAGGAPEQRDGDG
ncbi:MAG: hypothetical protein QOI18_2070, partial [Solirubrobacteraceae bacterium]|nr:hypothetical protein [Solirubrobacteraceae bacterium]